ncbi:GntR family transcriptional regulator [Desulfoscipio sp. XC116]|uniref:GntR family transcriptional regulator n=1 Tax=Desulfoscipio sp. XC116 TaxID=3144975 RepID=UPI00325B2185
MENNKPRRKAQVRLLKEQAYEIIKEGIINAFYKPGDELRETSLSEEIGMSKTPIREALIQLENEGFVQIRPFKGAIVTDISIEDVVKLYEFREIIEKFAVETATYSFTEDELKYLEKQIQLMELALEDEAFNEYDVAHNNFHYLIVSKTQNKWINKALANMEDYVKRVRNIIMKNEPINFIGDYKQLLKAFENKNARAAGKIIEKHLTKVVEIYKKSKTV